MAQQYGDISIQIFINEADKRQNSSDLSEDLVWHPLDRLEGHVIIQSPVPLAFDRVLLRLEGINPLSIIQSKDGLTD